MRMRSLSAARTDEEEFFFWLEKAPRDHLELNGDKRWIEKEGRQFENGCL